MDNNIQKMLSEIEDMVSPDMNSIEMDEALSRIDEVLNIEPQNIDALSWKAIVYEMKNDYDKALEIYEEILKIAPDDKMAKDSIKNCKELKELLSDHNPNGSGGGQNYKYEVPDVLEKVSIWHILALKVIVILIVLAYFFV